MRIRFENNEYIRYGRNMTGLGAFCYEVFKKYLNENIGINYFELKNTFNNIHCNNNKIIQNEEEFHILTENQKNRYFKKLNYGNMILYFSTQWGNNGYENGLECNNINHMIQFAKEQHYNIEILEENIIEPVIPLIQDSIPTKNIILYGAPGVGKTHNYQRIISMIEKGNKEKDIFDTITNNSDSQKVELDNDTFHNIKDDKQVEFITFHQNYSYEDFIEGFRPNESGNIKLEDGIFKNIINQALEQQNKNFYIVIDEINRGNISKIFGELITLIEEDKRDNYEITLPYSKEKFKIPSNLYIMATMNSTDKSIATIDIALRRRFTFLKMKPNLELVDNSEAKELMEKLNIYIKNKLGEDYMLGHSYFMKVQNNDDLEFVKEYKIKPLLEEYFYADDDKLDEVAKIMKDNQ